MEQSRRSAGVQSRGEYLADATKRRQEAVRMLQEGLSKHEIAEKLGVHERTIRRYFQSMDKCVPLYG